MFNIMLFNNFSFKDFFEKINEDATRNYWTFKEFEYLNTEFIGISDAECKAVFQSMFLKES